MSDDIDYTVQNSAVLNKLAREKAVAEERAEAYRKNLEKDLRRLKGDDNAMRNVKKEIANLINNNYDMGKALSAAGMSMRSRSGGFNTIEESDPTGFEPRPWERDE